MNPVGWFEIYVNDMQRAKAFYEGVFGDTLTRVESPLEMWSFGMGEVPGAPGALVKMEGFRPSGNGVIVYFKCEDCAVEAAKAKQCGGRVEKEKFSIGQFGHIALVVDTEGNVIGLHSMK